jgi:two-component system, cell cycle sensor histidine kinase and response regulator CckA
MRSRVTELQVLSAEVIELKGRLADAEQALLALSRGEVDAVAEQPGSGPVLLRAAQHKLLESERLLRAIFDGALDAVLLADYDGVCLDANPAACTLFGLPRHELLGRRIADFAAREVPAWREQLLRSGRLEGEFQIVRPDGVRDLDFRATANILPGLHMAVLRDVTERRLAEQTRARLAAIVESSEDAIVSEDVEELITTWNRGAERLFQWSAAEAIGQSMALVTPAELLGHERRVLDMIRRGEQVEQYETRRRRKDGVLIDVSVSTSVLRDSSGAIMGASRIARDFTAQRAAEAALRKSEEQLRQAQKMEAVGVLAGGVAHDFNNLLSVIGSYAVLLLSQVAKSDPMRRDIEEIRLAGERATKLTRQLLAFGRRQVLNPQVLVLQEVVAGMEQMLKRLINEGIELSLPALPSAGRVFADASQLEQVIMNLVVNARDAMPRGGRLAIETAVVELDEAYARANPGVRPGNYMLLSVTDTGTGMDAATRQRIFEPFFTTKERGKGTGLGLSTVFGIVQQSDGHISVRSEPGQGSTFELYFPLTEQVPSSRISVTPPSTNVRGTETILVVEDDDQVRVLTRSILRRQGYTVLDSQNAGEAFLLCESHPTPIDLLLTDVVMPRMSGRELAKRLAPMMPGMKVLYTSGHSDILGDDEQVPDAASFLPKPITPDALLRKVREVLEAACQTG